MSKRKKIESMLVSMILAAALFLPVSAGAVAGEGLRPTPASMDFYGYIAGARAGDEVTVHDENGVLCGRSVISGDGQYGIVHVYADDSTTVVDEGASFGSPLTFRLNGIPMLPLSAEQVIWLGDGKRQQVDFKRD